VAPSLVSVDLSACRLTRIRAPSHSVIGDKALRRSFDPDAVKILLQLTGRARFDQAGVFVELGPRSAAVYDPVHTYALHNDSAVDQIILQVPRATCGDETLARLKRPFVLPSEEDSLVRIVYNLMQMASTEADRLDEFGCRRVGDSLIHLVRGLVTRDADNVPGRMAPLAALKERIVDYVDSRIGKGSLSLDDIARKMGCSRRYLHRAFETEDTTLERFVWERRLEASRKALLAPENDDRSISEIAFACGFNSSAHFSRAFKSRYGLVPREIREQRRVARH
jgi:AraC-like DNA-binding protein